MHEINRNQLYMNILRYLVVAGTSEVLGELLVDLLCRSSGCGMSLLPAHQYVEGVPLQVHGLGVQCTRLANEDLQV